jgi:aspartate oxidase
MGVLIVGSGIAGLMSAIKIKEADPETMVAVIEKEKPTGNTQISGLRFRQKEIEGLLAKRNDGHTTPEMKLFSTIAGEELNALMSRIPSEIRQEWFGPQLTEGVGTRLLTKLRDIVSEKGIEFITGEAVQLMRDSNKITGVKTTTGELTADMTILANGTVSGELYLSTNRPIKNSSHMLAFRAGIPLQDATVHMFHPFGKCDKEGNPQLGCFETDKLSGAEVRYLDGREADPITNLLRNHDAHNNFPAISEAIIKNGGVVELLMPDGRIQHARVSHHYGHIGIRTVDGVRVKDFKGIMAVGDASNLGYWTNHRERLPGYALLKCLVDARLVAEHVNNMGEGQKTTPVGVREISGETILGDEPALNRDLQRLNTEMLFKIVFDRTQSPEEVGWQWAKRLQEVRKSSLIAEMSYGIAKAHYLRARYPEIEEPLGIRREDVPIGEMGRTRRYL